MLEATIGLNEVEPEPASDSEEELAPGEFTPNDLNFLKSLRITLTEEDEPPRDRVALRPRARQPAMAKPPGP